MDTSNIINQIASFESLLSAFNDVFRSDNKYKKEAVIFYKDLVYNLNKLSFDLMNGYYKPREYFEFKVYEPKERIIHAPHFIDKIVQVALNKVIRDIFLRYYIKDSYACIVGRGTHAAVDQVQRYMRLAQEEYGDDCYVIKLDISKFFYSIDRGLLKSIIFKIIKCDKTRDIIGSILDSMNMISPLGLPLGNTTSQSFANIYMNRFDQFCKRILKIKYYIRYMDDSIAIVLSKKIAQDYLKQMDEFISKGLNLTLNPKKTKIFPLRQGINAYGCKIHITHRLLRNDSKKKIKRKVKKFHNLLRRGLITVEKVESILNSWYGHAKQCNSFNFIQKLVNKHKYIDLFSDKLIVVLSHI